LLQILFFCKKFISCFHYGTLLFDVNGLERNTIQGLTFLVIYILY